MSENLENNEYLKDIDVMKIMDRIPHRYPFLLVDKIIDIKPFESAIGVKCVTVNEPHFQGHFPQRPIMPGVLIIESMAQTAGVLVVSSLGPEAEGKLVYFMSIDNCKFRKPVVPGDKMLIEVVKQQRRGPVWKFKGIAMVDDKVVAEANIAAMIRDA